MAQGAKIYSGTYVPSVSSANVTIDTGVTGWTHFLIVPHILPYATPHARCLGAKYVDLNMRYYMSAFGSSSDSSTTASVVRTTLDTSSPSYADCVMISGSSITLTRLIPSQGGTFQAGTQYDWYAW